MSLRITNTLSGKKEDFETVEPSKVRMYVCGPTVYDRAHIGHAMSTIIFDIIRRYLEYSGYEVIYAQNFTDVDDKIINRANVIGVDPSALAEQLITDWLNETEELNVEPATLYPRATNEMGTIIGMIERLIEKEKAYSVDNGDVYFRVQSFDQYGKLSHRKLKDMQAGSRIDIDQRKEHPMDFALWKVAKPDEPSWDSPWGKGRPGWHIECSAMIEKHLGGSIDIHGGGSDLIFPHHENEITQSEAHNCGRPLARYWVHNGMLQFSGEKMSKSVGNLISIRELLDQGGGEIFRFMVLGSHYRTPLTYTPESYESARRGLLRLGNALRSYTGGGPAERPDHHLARLADDIETRFAEAMDDDFNTPVALSHLFELARAINRAENGDNQESASYAQHKLKRLTAVLGLTFTTSSAGDDTDIDLVMQILIDVRKELREARLFEMADMIRDRLNENGIALEDSADGTNWRRDR